MKHTIKTEDAPAYNTDIKEEIKRSGDDVIKRALAILEARLKTLPNVPPFTSPGATTDYLKFKLALEEREHFHILYLNNQHHLIEDVRLFSGTIDGAAVYPREVVKTALMLNANAVIFAHNHPSGMVEPSQCDKTITAKLKGALALVEIKVLDHIIIGGLNSFSFAERGII